VHHKLIPVWFFTKAFYCHTPNRDVILRELDQRKEVLYAYYDISKVFDKVSHRALIIFKLRRFGISGDFIHLLVNYLTNRIQRVMLNGAKSNWKDVEAGVPPQGSVLGPLMFLIFVNDISRHTVPSKSHF
jgi:hypothetical protein